MNTTTNIAIEIGNLLNLTKIGSTGQISQVLNSPSVQEKVDLCMNDEGDFKSLLNMYSQGDYLYHYILGCWDLKCVLLIEDSNSIEEVATSLRKGPVDQGGRCIVAAIERTHYLSII